ncbi:MAG: copper-translocating P-type ATPase [Spirochaetae bacterium HGW-Spirochaetae-2]|jgi:Cd2+/Zn2+-exporting ATPase|nr:MAG: copper-translocating P-type ATPase [Spirochaetae bacterium HGW-Spirochaetae-2]
MHKTSTLIMATVLVVASFFLHRLYGYISVTIAVMLASTALAGYPVVRKAIGALRYRIVGIEVLVSVATIGAVIIGEYWEAAAVTYLFLFGGYLEAKTLEKTRSSIKALLNLAPETARIVKNGKEEVVDPKSVVQGDRVIVKPGERIAVDGTVEDGLAYVNQSTVTGESLPVERQAGQQVFAGTVVESGYLIVEAEKVGDQTTFARILELVEEAQDAKAKTQKFLERFSQYYTPGIMVLSLVLFLFTRDIRLSLTLLVIACPGALVISAPVSIVAGIGNGAKKGILVKGGDVMERLGTVRAIAFDKTGTVTKGEPEVVFLQAFDIDRDELLGIAASGETYAEHPIAKAIVGYASERLAQDIRIPEETNPIPGKGVVFVLGGKTYLLGNRALFADHTVSLEIHEPAIRAEEELARTVVIVGSTERVLGFFAIADTVRPQAKELLKALKKIGIRHVVMLTGDNERTARAIAGQLGFDSYRASLLPQDKVSALKELQAEYGTVAMVGDGVNDAPALATADLGIAIGGAGSDVAMETADVIVMSSHLSMLTHAVGLSRATVRNMKQNIVFAILVAVILLAGVLVRTVDLSFGMLVHEFSVLLVIINAIRLMGYGKNTKL